MSDYVDSYTVKSAAKDREKQLSHKQGRIRYMHLNTQCHPLPSTYTLVRYIIAQPFTFPSLSTSSSNLSRLMCWRR